MGEINKEQPVETGIVTRKETATVNNLLVDIVKLEEYLENLKPQPPIVDVSLNDPVMLKAVDYGQTYWSTESGEALGPHAFLTEYQKQKAIQEDLTVDDFLEQLLIARPDWKQHIVSLQLAKTNLAKPIWVTVNNDNERFPFDGMHRLTRAYLENRDSVQTIFWDDIPEEGIIKKIDNDKNSSHW